MLQRTVLWEEEIAQSLQSLHVTEGKFWERWEYQTTWPAFWETYMKVRKQELELGMEQKTGFK